MEHSRGDRPNSADDVHLHGGSDDRSGVGIAHLAVMIVTPCPYGAVVSEGIGGRARTRSDRNDPRRTGNGSRSGAAGDGASVSEFPGTVVAPRPDPAEIVQCHGEGTAGVDGNDVSGAGYLPGVSRVRTHGNVGPPKCSSMVDTPAQHGAVVAEGNGVTVADAHGDDPVGDLDRDQPVGRGSVSELAAVIDSGRPDGPVRTQCQAVAISSGHLRDERPLGDGISGQQAQKKADAGRNVSSDEAFHE